MRIRLFNLIVIAFILPNCLIASEVSVGVSFSIPPYVIAKDDTGIELEILSEAFKVNGHKIKPIYLPLARTFHLIQNGQVDAIINVKDGVVDNVFYSDVVISFQNCAISLAKRDFPDFKDAAYLRDKRVIAFQRASFLLGEEFGNMASENKHYQERSKQVSQVYRLFTERNVDFIIMDKNIFSYYRKQLLSDKLLSAQVLEQEVKYHYFLDPTQYRFAFRDKKIRDDFNNGLQTIKSNGTYQEIFMKYRRQMMLGNKITTQ